MLSMTDTHFLLRWRVFISLVILIFCYPAYAQIQSDQPFVVSNTVESKLATLLMGYQPRSRISTLTSSDAETVKGRSYSNEQHTRFVIQTNGLWASDFRKKEIGATNTDFSLSLSVCGLFSVVTNDKVSNIQEESSPIEGLFLPYGFRDTQQAFLTAIGVPFVSRIKTFTTNSKNICSPIPDSEFSYRLENEVFFRFKDQYRNITSVEEASCKVSAIEKPANQIFAQLRGTYLGVTCNYKPVSGITLHRDLIFLRDSGMYLIVESRDELGKGKITFTDVRYTDEK